MAAVFCLAASLAAAAAQHAQVLAQPPPILIVSEKTLAERVGAVHAALLVRVLGVAQSRAVDISASLQRGNRGAAVERPVVMTVTESDVVVLEAFKAGGISAGSTIRIGTIGGRAAWGGRDIVIRRRTPDLQKSATYVVLLRREQDWNDALMFRDDEVFKVEGGFVTALPHAGAPDYAKELVGLREADALQNLRTAAQR